MADYNIYIHSYGQYDAPTTPFQLRAESDTSGVGGEGGGSGGSGFGAVRRAASFLTNGESLIGQIMSTPVGAIGVSVAGGVAVTKLLVDGAFKTVDKVMSLYNRFIVPNTGKYKQSIEWANVMNTYNSMNHPFQSFLASIQARQEIERNNAKNEQAELLLGGSIYSSRYGRYL